MSTMTDELVKLQALHASGDLSDGEYAAAKAAVLAGGPSTAQTEAVPAKPPGPDEVKMHDELQRLDRDWKVERETHLIGSAFGLGYAPRPWMGLLLIAVSLYVGLNLVGSMLALNAFNRVADEQFAHMSNGPLGAFGQGATWTGPDGKPVALDFPSPEPLTSPLSSIFGFYSCFGFLFMIMVGVIGVHHYRKGMRYLAAEKAHLRRREALLAGAVS